MKRIIGDRLLFLLFLILVAVMFLTKSFTISMIIFINLWMLVIITTIIQSIYLFLKSKKRIKVPGVVKEVEFINTDNEKQNSCKAIVVFFWPSNEDKHEATYYADSIKRGDTVTVSVYDKKPEKSIVMDQFTKDWKLKLGINILVVIGMMIFEYFLIVQQ